MSRRSGTALATSAAEESGPDNRSVRRWQTACGSTTRKMRKHPESVPYLAKSDVLEALSQEPTESAAPRWPEQPATSTDQWISPGVVLGLARLTEAILIAATGFITWAILQPETAAPMVNYYWAAILLSAGTVPLVFQAVGLYSIHALLRPGEHAGRLLLGWTSVLALFTAILFFAKIGDSYSRLWLGIWYASGLVTLLGLRVV